MRKMSSHHAGCLVYFCAAFFVLTASAGAQQAAKQAAPRLGDAALEARVNALLARMTLEEKIGQLIQRDAGLMRTGPGVTGTGWEAAVAKGGIGSLFNVTQPAQANAIQHAAVEQSRLHIPVLFGLDVIHGFRTAFPVPLAMAATWDPLLVQQAARIAAQEATAAGIRWTFSPMVDIARDARWGRIVESAGEDPYLGSVMARAYVNGYQGKRLDAPDSMAACAKHYVAYGGAEGGRDYNTVDISERTLRQIYLPPFHAAVQAGAATLMSAFNDLNSVPASANPFTLRQILKGEWKFQGFVVSDYNSIAELIPHGIALNGSIAARKAFLAGVDMDMEDHLYETLLAQARSGAIPAVTVDDAVRRILRVKFALGLFDHPYADASALPAHIPQENRDAARQMAEESFVLLKNESVNGYPVLPLGPNVKTLALIGPLADDAVDMLGPWHTSVSKPEDVVTLRAALQARASASNFKLTTAKGAGIWGDSTSGFAEAVEAARQADVVVMALGEDEGSSGEAGSRAHLGLPGNQQQLLEAVAATGKPIVLVLFNGHPLVLTSVAPRAAAVVEAWFPGTQAGDALVRTLFGDSDPSGHLTVSFPRAVGQEPLYYNALNTGRPADGVDLSHRPATPGERYHSRYIDELNSPLFPFGFGLSYTTFSFSGLKLDRSSVSAKEMNSGAAAPVHVQVRVTNTGSRDGVAVAQIYLRQQGGSVSLPVRQLAGFQRIRLAPGESQNVEFNITRDQLAFRGAAMKRAVEPGHVTVYAGPNSAEGLAEGFDIVP